MRSIVCTVAGASVAMLAGCQTQYECRGAHCLNDIELPGSPDAGGPDGAGGLEVLPDGGGDGTAVRSFAPVSDAFVRSGTFGTTNYGSDIRLNVKEDPATDFDRESYLRFEIGELDPNTIVSATLTLHVHFYTGLQRTAIFRVDDDSWEENAIVWNTRPAASGAEIGQVEPLGQGTTVSLEIGDAVLAESDGTLSLLLRSVILTTAVVEYSSRETAFAPRLDVVYRTGF